MDTIASNEGRNPFFIIFVEPVIKEKQIWKLAFRIQKVGVDFSFILLLFDNKL